MAFIKAIPTRYENRITFSGRSYIFIAGLIYDDTWVKLDVNGVAIISTSENATLNNLILNSSNQILVPQYMEYRIEGTEYDGLPPSGDPPSPTDARGQAIYALMVQRTQDMYAILVQQKKTPPITIPTSSDVLSKFPTISTL